MRPILSYYTMLLGMFITYNFMYMINKVSQLYNFCNRNTFTHFSSFKLNFEDFEVAKQSIHYFVLITRFLAIYAPHVTWIVEEVCVVVMRLVPFRFEVILTGIGPFYDWRTRGI